MATEGCAAECITQIAILCFGRPYLGSHLAIKNSGGHIARGNFERSANQTENMAQHTLHCLATLGLSHPESWPDTRRNRSSDSVGWREARWLTIFSFFKDAENWRGGSQSGSSEFTRLPASYG
jgi:hypothetical protein